MRIFDFQKLKRMCLDTNELPEHICDYLPCAGFHDHKTRELPGPEVDLCDTPAERNLLFSEGK